MSEQYKDKTTDQLAELVKNAFVCEDNEAYIIEFLKEQDENFEQDLDDLNFGVLEYLMSEKINWMDKEQLIDFIENQDILI